MDTITRNGGFQRMEAVQLQSPERSIPYHCYQPKVLLVVVVCSL